jgi:SAM-dependent methyltransferase
MRDTDADWRKLGATEPYWGVLTHSDYLSQNLTPERIEAFYASGREYVDDVLARFARIYGATPGGAALDFGCGAGRLTEAMAERTAAATGYDISPGMLEKARSRGGRALYVDALPAGPFDWINSFIVLQHIPPARGLAVIESLLARLAPGGFVSLQLTYAREPHLEPSGGWRRLARGLRSAPPVGVISMYDYDLSAVMRRLTRAGVGETTLVPTDHGGHHGAIILGRRGDAA